MGTWDNKDLLLSTPPQHRQQNDTQAQPSESAKPDDHNIDQVRELLFGTHMRELKKRSEHLEQQTTRALKQSREQLNQRLDSIEQLIRREIQSLKEEIGSERSTREAAQRDVLQKLQQTEVSFSQVVTDLQEECAASYEQLGKDIQSNTQQLRNESQQSFDSLHELFSEKCSALDRSKVDSTVIGGLFNEVALRLMSSTNQSDDE